jgi:uncharacterized protein (TIGR02646 family)
MRAFTRNPAPQWFLDNCTRWSSRYAQKRRDASKKDDFQWATYNKQKVNKRIEPILQAMTQNHCAFCDGYPIGALGAQIEHFEPVSLCPEKSYEWDNLFYSCTNCNNHKKDRFDANLLKPDASTYSFLSYFIFDFSTGFIKPNPRKAQESQDSAMKTIDLYGLNAFGRPEARLEEILKFRNITYTSLDIYPYRFILELL